MLVLKFHTSLVLQWLLHALSESPGMKKSLLGPQGPLFAIQLAILFAILLAIHVGLLDRKFAHERAWYALWSSFFPASMKMFRLSLFPFSGSHVVILGCHLGAMSFRRVLVFWYHLCTLYVPLVSTSTETDAKTDPLISTSTEAVFKDESDVAAEADAEADARAARMEECSPSIGC